MKSTLLCDHQFLTRCATTFVLRGRPQTYKPPRHRRGQKHFYCGHKKEIKAARRDLEAKWGGRDAVKDAAVRLDIWACNTEQGAALQTAEGPLQKR